MKELEQAARFFSNEVDNRDFSPEEEFIDGFKKGVQYVTTLRQITPNDCPPVATEVIFYSEQWVNEHFNPQGIRIGFLDNFGNYVTAQYNIMKETYVQRENSQFDEEPKSQTPTHWMPITINF